MKQHRGRAEDLGALRGPDRAEIADAIAVDVGFDLLAEIACVLHDPTDDEPAACAASDLDRLGRALVGMNSAERDQGIAARGRERQHVEIDAVMNRSHVFELRRAVGIGDRHVGGVARVHVRGQRAAPGEAMNRRDHRCSPLSCECEGQPVEVVVDQVELGRARERVCDMQRLPDPAIHPCLPFVADRAHAIEVRGSLRVERGEERHVDAARDEPLCDQARDLLPGPVVPRGRTPGDWAQDGDPHETCGRGMDLFIDRSAREMWICLLAVKPLVTQGTGAIGP